MSCKRVSDADQVYGSWSRIEMYKCKAWHSLTIEDFLHRARLTKAGETLYSAKFVVPARESQNLIFQLQVRPNGDKAEDNGDYVSVYLSRLIGQEALEVQFDFSVQKSDGSSWRFVGGRKTFSLENSAWGSSKAFAKAELSEKADELLPGGCLTIICDLEAYCCDRLTEGRKSAKVVRVEEHSRIGDNLGHAFTQPEFSDVIVVCGKSRFPCHKVILSARSDVFAAMFAHKNTSESQTGEVVITDMEPDVLKLLLQFIYTYDIGEKELRQSASSLLTAADKYNIPRLKSVCEASLGDHLDMSTVANVLVLAHLHEANNLKALAKAFVTDNLDKVMETPGWKVISEAYPSMLNEILRSYVAKNGERTNRQG